MSQNVEETGKVVADVERQFQAQAAPSGRPANLGQPDRSGFTSDNRGTLSDMCNTPSRLMPFTKNISIVFGMVLCVLALAAPAAATPTPAEASLLQVVNQARAQHGVAPLRIDYRLEAAARAKSRSMLRTGTFSHGNFARRLSSYRARGPYFGENLAWGVGSRGSAAGVVQMWLSSPSHRANLLRRSFQRVGLGIYVGTFRGYGGTSVVTANFAGR